MNESELIDKELELLKQKLSENINKMMKHEQLNQDELASETGKCPSEISRILGGNKNATLRSLVEVASAGKHRVEINFIPLS